jgi:predicted DNA-binding transcriptional regulator YafY
MKVFEYLDRIRRMHSMVQRNATGTPDECARQLGVSRTTLYELIDELRLRGAPIAYSKSARTFYYSSPFDITITCSLKSLTMSEEKKSEGGAMFFQSSFFPDNTIRNLYNNITI